MLLCGHCHSHLCILSCRSGIQKVISVYSPWHQVLANLPWKQNKPLKNSRAEVLGLYTIKSDSFFFFTFYTLRALTLQVATWNTIFENEPNDPKTFWDLCMIFHLISKWYQSIAPTSKITISHLSDVKLLSDLWMQIMHWMRSINQTTGNLGHKASRHQHSTKHRVMAYLHTPGFLLSTIL